MSTMPTTIGQVLKYEAPQAYSRDDVTVLSTEVLAVGTVVGRVTATGLIRAWTPAAADGSQNAIGVSLVNQAATAANRPGVIAARHAIVARDSLVFAGAPTQPQRDGAIAALRALGILARTTA